MCTKVSLLLHMMDTFVQAALWTSSKFTTNLHLWLLCKYYVKTVMLLAHYLFSATPSPIIRHRFGSSCMYIPIDIQSPSQPLPGGDQGKGGGSEWTTGTVHGAYSSQIQQLVAVW